MCMYALCVRQSGKDISATNIYIYISTGATEKQKQKKQKEKTKTKQNHLTIKIKTSRQLVNKLKFKHINNMEFKQQENESQL